MSSHGILVRIYLPTQGRSGYISLPCKQEESRAQFTDRVFNRVQKGRSIFADDHTFKLVHRDGRELTRDPFLENFKTAGQAMMEVALIKKGGDRKSVQQECRDRSRMPSSA
eukprot:TRINITY_DN111538_c0_g2_i2.p1 TRINITY_DN111538_c0_g2~~TRINITY_DN111538_c0_g2_i2.p1  ORF type:complete len:111 (+),score=12.26 TRINITY_DN111538_c0_g2_i2:83-415(+)